MNGTARINGHPRRGSALLLVTIAMASSIVLAGAYVASRADGTVVGANLASSSDARNRVESALAVTTELLLNDEDWRTKHVDGVIIDEQSIEHGIRVRLTDLATGDAPSLDTVDVQAEIIGRAGVIERVADATFFVPLPAQNISVDLDLGEFAIFAGSNIEINSEAVVAPWEASPASHRGDPIRLATMLGRSSGISISGNAAVVDGVEFSSHPGSTGSGSLPVAHLPDQVAVPSPAPPKVHSDGTFTSEIPQRIYGHIQTNDVEMGEGETYELFAGASLMIEGDLDMSPGSTLRISGASEIVITGDVDIDQAVIEVPLDSALTMHIGGDLQVRDSAIHEPGGTEDNWVANVDRIRLVSMATRESIPVWKFRGRTLMKGECYAPSTRIVMRERAIVVGRLLGQKIKIDGCAQLLYDPALDDRNGYTAPDGRAFDETGRVPDVIKDLETLAPRELAEASLKMNTLIVANVLGNLVPDDLMENSEIDDRTSRGERRSQLRSQRAMKLRAMMQQTARHFEEFAQQHAQFDFNRFTTQSSMRVNSIGSRQNSNGHGAR